MRLHSTSIVCLFYCLFLFCGVKGARGADTDDDEIPFFSGRKRGCILSACMSVADEDWLMNGSGSEEEDAGSANKRRAGFKARSRTRRTVLIRVGVQFEAECWRLQVFAVAQWFAILLLLLIGPTLLLIGLLRAAEGALVQSERWAAGITHDFRL